MKIKNVGIAICAGMMVAALGLAGCSGGSSSAASSSSAAETTEEIMLVNPGKLTIAASLDFPPFENLEGEEAVGFEVDLMKALAEKMGVEAEYLPSTKFDTIIPMITAGGKADVGVSGFTVTEDRKKEIDFTEVIMDSNQGRIRVTLTSISWRARRSVLSPAPLAMTGPSRTSRAPRSSPSMR